MSDQGIFEDKENEKGDDLTKPSTELFADKLKTIVDDNGKPKYESTDKALDALAHSQAHIKRLEEEASSRNDELTKALEELNSRKTVEDFVNRLAPDPNPNTDPKTPEVVNGLDENKVAELISNTLTQREKQALEANNVNTVVNKLKEKFGDSAAEEVSKVAKDNGMTTKELQEMSASRPQLVLNLFGEKAPKPQSTTTSHSNVAEDHSTTDDEGKTKLLRGGITSKELTAGWKAIGKDIHDKYGIES